MTTNFLQQFEQRLPLAGPSFWQKLRREGLANFSALGYPTRQWEEWKYTKVQQIADSDFSFAPDKELKNFTLEEMHRLAFCVLPGPRLVFLNGHFHPTLSDLSALPDGVKAMSLKDAAVSETASIEAALAQAVPFQKHPFAALNTAFLQDGAYIYLPKGVNLTQPLQLLFVSHGNGVATISHPRVLVIADELSQASIIETYVGEGAYFTNAVTEMVAQAGAQIEHIKLQGESEQAFHIASIGVKQARDSQYVSHSISLGGALVRNDLSTLLNDEGAAATLNGLYMVSGNQHVDNHTSIDHAKPHCTSAELYKGILDGHSQGVFNGRILVRAGAQKTSSQQVNKNLILSDDALINTKPLLEIYANDVKCNHGATIGRLDENQLFYLRSRGIDAALARSMLTYAFASEVLSALHQEALRERLQSLMFARLMLNAEAA